MGITFTHFKVNKFPKLKDKGNDGDVVVSLGDPHLQGSPEKTKVTFKVKEVYGVYERYGVYHENVRRVQGRTYGGEDFDSFYEKKTFDIFLDRKQSLLICNTSRRVAKSFIDTLNERKKSQFNLDYLLVDFAAVKGRTNDVRGVWVNNMAEPFLETAAFYGQNVEQSDSCRNAQASGKASSKLISYGFGDASYPIILTAHCNICLLRDDPEELNFELLRHIHDNLLKDAISTEDSKYNGRLKREAAKAEAKAKQAAAKAASPAPGDPTGLFP